MFVVWMARRWILYGSNIERWNIVFLCLLTKRNWAIRVSSQEQIPRSVGKTRYMHQGLFNCVRCGVVQRFQGKFSSSTSTSNYLSLQQSSWSWQLVAAMDEWVSGWVGGWCSWNISTPPRKKERNKQTATTKWNSCRKQRTTGNVPELKEGYIAAVHLGTVNSQGSHSPHLRANILQEAIEEEEEEEQGSSFNAASEGSTHGTKLQLQTFILTR